MTATVTDTRIPLAERNRLLAALDAWEGVEDLMLTCKICGVRNFHPEIDGDYICRNMANHPVFPEVGMPATIHFFSDTLPAVVTHVTPKTIVVRRVEVLEEPVTVEGHPDYPTVTYQGDITNPIGQPERYRMTPQGRYQTRSGVRVSLGSAIRRIDFRY